MKTKIVLVIIFSFTICPTLCETIACNENNETMTLPMCLPKNYAKEIAPAVFNFKDREVAVYLDIIEIEDIDIIEGSISYKLYFLMLWIDSRIVIRKDLLKNESWNHLDLEVKNNVWMPDLQIYRTEKTYKDRVLTSEFLQVNGLKKFYVAIEFSIKTKCDMDLGEFPHDKQKCLLEVGSFGYSDQLILLHYHSFEDYSHSIPYPNGYTVTIDKMNKTVSWPTLGNFTNLGLEVTMVRHVSFYMLNYYIPTGLMVIVSFSAFIIPASDEGLLGRIASLVTLLLVVMSVFNEAKSNLPASDVPNYIEIWMIICIFFILAAFAQSTVVFWILRTKNRVSKNVADPKDGTTDIEWETTMKNSHSTELINLAINEKTIKKIEKIDYASLIIFTSIFLLFNIFFWTVTMTSYS